MSAGFGAVQWNRAKLVYDGFLLASVTLYISAYLTVVYWLDPPNDQLSAIDLRIRAFGSCAFFMLTTILSIGPLARLDRRFLPLLYNRRHFGVLTFFVVLLHASFMVEWYAVQDALPSLYDELTKVSDYGKFIGFPFKALGLVALLILFLMAATSHDYWLVFLTPPVWKGLHMACAVKRRRFPVGASPTRQSLQPEATGAVMEVTKWLKPSDSGSRYTVTARVCRP